MKENEKYKNSFIIEYDNKSIIKTIISKYAQIIDTYDENNKVIMLEDGYIYEDLNNNKNTERLIKSGIKVYFGHNKKNLKESTQVVISSAIKKNNPEVLFCQKKKNTNLYKR